MENSCDCNPLVSIIINCFNGQDYLRRAIDSVIYQSYQKWEIIFWDNQSIDETKKIIQSYTDNRIKYFYAPSHTLLYQARNYAIEKSSGDMIAFLDADDWWHSSKLEKQLSLFDDFNIDFVYSNYLIFNQKTGKEKVAFKNRLPTGKIYQNILKNYPVNISTLIFRKRVLTNLLHAFDSRYHIIGDFDFVCRMSINHQFACVQTPLISYRVHSRSESIKRHDLLIQELNLWLKDNIVKYNELFPNKKHPTQEFIDFLEFDMEVITGNKRMAFRRWKSMSIGMLKVKSLVMLLMPIWLIKKYRNFLKPLE